MATEIRLPQFGETMEEGTIVNALVKEGDQVSKGDVIFEIETDKVMVEMESPASGFVKKILIEVGQTVPVDTAVMILGDEKEDIPEGFINSVKSISAQVAPQPEVLIGEDAERNADRDEREGADSVVLADVDGVEIVYEPGQKIAPSRLQKITGQKMLQSKCNIPCFYLNTEVDVTEMVELRAELNEAGSVQISFNDFIVRAVALGLKEFPIMTGQPAGDFIQLAEGIHVGLAISVNDGLVAPLIKNADSKSLAEISAYIKELIEKAKGRDLSLEDIEGGCITVSNLGGFGIDSFIPIVVPGQCSILGVGRITDTCVPVSDNVVVRKIVNLTLSVDHRVVNGAGAAQFLDFVKKMLEDAKNLT